MKAGRRKMRAVFPFSFSPFPSSGDFPAVKDIVAADDGANHDNGNDQRSYKGNTDQNKFYVNDDYFLFRHGSIHVGVLFKFIVNR